MRCMHILYHHMIETDFPVRGRDVSIHQTVTTVVKTADAIITSRIVEKILCRLIFPPFFMKITTIRVASPAFPFLFM